VESMRETVIGDEIESATLGDLDPHEWDIDPFEASIFNIFGLQISIKEWVKENPNITTEEVQNRLVSITVDAYKNKGQSIGPVMKDFEKQILLQIIDASWKDHLAEVDALRQGIGLRSYGNKNPKLEFRRESFELFESLLNKIRLEGIRFLSRVEIELEDSGELNLPKQDRKQTLDHQNPQSALATPKQESNPENNQEQASGNRRLRRAEAKLARKNAKKK